MNYRTLSNTHLSISRVAFGCMSLRQNTVDAAALIQRALDEGINLFDTADLYDQGANETLLGKALAGRRQQALIATKVGNQWRMDGSGWDWNPTKKYILAAADQSLRRLATDYIDLYQLHGGTINDPIDETIEAFEILQQQGKIRYYGLSSIRPNVIREWVGRSRMISVMMQYSLLDRRPEETMLPLLQEKGIGLLARGSLAQGLLAGKAPKPYLDHDAESVQAAAKAIRSTTSAGDETSAATGFVLHHPAVASAIVGIRTPQQLEAALRAGNQLNLSEADWIRLSTEVPANKYTGHR